MDTRPSMADIKRVVAEVNKFNNPPLKKWDCKVY